MQEKGAVALQPLKSNISAYSILAAMALASVVPGAVRAQSPDASDPSPATQPITSRAQRTLWNSTVNLFASALIDSTDSTALRALVNDDVIVRQFNRAGRQEISNLRDHVTGMHVIMSRTYMQTPGTLAGDIANAIKDVPLPDEVKRRLTPADEAALKRANTTASTWVSASLFTNGSEPVAVVVLWKEGMEPPTTQPEDDEPADKEAKGEKKPEPKLAPIAMPVFILLKGDAVTDGRIKISQICFGNPLTFSAPPSDSSADSTDSGN